MGLVWLGGRGCDALRGTPSCGGYGVIMLVVIVAVMLAVGVFGLRALQVRDAGMVTFFGVALPLIMIMSLLIDAVFSPWMALVVPLLGAGCFAAAAYVVPALENSLHEENAEVASQQDQGGMKADGNAEATTMLPRYAPADPTRATSPSAEQETAARVTAESIPGDDDGSELLAEDGQPLLGSAEAGADDPGENDATAETRAASPTIEGDKPSSS